MSKKEGSGEASENKYALYQEMGGIINEKDYQKAFDTFKEVKSHDQNLTVQTETIARAAGITLHNTRDSLDSRTALYGVLRQDVNPDPEYHHSQMSDQRLFAEALRMLGDEESLQKLIKSHPHISF